MVSTVRRESLDCAKAVVGVSGRSSSSEMGDGMRRVVGFWSMYDFFFEPGAEEEEEEETGGVCRRGSLGTARRWAPLLLFMVCIPPGSMPPPPLVGPGLLLPGKLGYMGVGMRAVWWRSVSWEKSVGSSFAGRGGGGRKAWTTGESGGGLPTTKSKSVSSMSISISMSMSTSASCSASEFLHSNAPPNWFDSSCIEAGEFDSDCAGVMVARSGTTRGGEGVMEPRGRTGSAGYVEAPLWKFWKDHGRVF